MFSGNGMSSSFFFVAEASMQDPLCGEHGHDVSSGQTLRCPGSLGLLIVSSLNQSWVSMGPQQKPPWKGKGLHPATATVSGQVCHIRPPCTAPITTAVPVWLSTSKLLAFLNTHSEFYLPALWTRQFPTSTEGQAFIPGLKEYALASLPFLFSFGEVIKTALIISKQPTFS